MEESKWADILPKTEEKPAFGLGIKEIGALLGGFLIGQIIIAAIGLIMLFAFNKNFQTSPEFLIIAYVIAMICPILLFDIFIFRSKGKKMNFDFSSRPLGTYLLIFPMMIGMMFIAEYVTDLIPTTGPLLGSWYQSFLSQMNSISANNVGMIVMTSILAPILEEILFRGIILKGMLNKGVNPKKAIFISAFIFGAIHGYPWQFVGALLLGLVLGLVYYKTKSLLLPILLHAFNNFVSCLLIINTKAESFSNAFHVPDWALLMVGILLFGTFYYLFMHRNKVAYLEN